MAIKLDQISAIETALKSEYDSKIYALERAQSRLVDAQAEKQAILARRTANVGTTDPAEGLDMQAVAIWTASTELCLPRIQAKISNAIAEVEAARSAASESFARLEGAKRMKADIVKAMRKKAEKAEENAIEAMVQVSRGAHGD